MSRFTFPPHSNKLAAAATLVAGAAALTACGAETAETPETPETAETAKTSETDGVYVGTSPNGNVEYRLSIEGDSCEFTSTADFAGEVPLQCEIDTEAETVSLDGYPAPYRVEDNGLVFTVEGEEILFENES